ncbi:MAG: hypothetical protein WB564_03765 [Dehalococcoidia bacterium]
MNKLVFLLIALLLVFSSVGVACEGGGGGGGLETLTLEQCAQEVQESHEFEEYLVPGYNETIAAVPVIFTPLELPAGTIVSILNTTEGDFRVLNFTYGDTGVRLGLKIRPGVEGEANVYYGNITEMTVTEVFSVSNETQKLGITIQYPQRPDCDWEEEITPLTAYVAAYGGYLTVLLATVKVAGQEKTVMFSYPSNPPPWPDWKAPLGEVFNWLIANDLYPKPHQDVVLAETRLAAANALVWGAVVDAGGAGRKARDDLRGGSVNWTKVACIAATLLGDVCGTAAMTTAVGAANVMILR